MHREIDERTSVDIIYIEERTIQDYLMSSSSGLLVTSQWRVLFEGHIISFKYFGQILMGWLKDEINVVKHYFLKSC